MAFEKTQKVISNDQKGIFTIISLVSAVVIYVNSTNISSIYLGVTFSIIYFLINSTFTGNILFKDESAGFRFILGFFVMLMLVAVGGAAIIIATALIPIQFNVTASTGLLFLLTVGTSILNNKRVSKKLHKEK